MPFGENKRLLQTLALDAPHDCTRRGPGCRSSPWPGVSRNVRGSPSSITLRCGLKPAHEPMEVWPRVAMR